MKSSDSSYESSAVAAATLALFSPGLRAALFQERVFLDSLGLETDSVISFHDGALLFRRSTLFAALRTVLVADPAATATVTDEKGTEWRMQKSGPDQSSIEIHSDSVHYGLPDFSGLSPARDARMSGLEKIRRKHRLPRDTSDHWEEILAARALSDSEQIELHDDLNDTPIGFQIAIRPQLSSPELKLASLVPRSARYYERLVGRWDDEISIVDYGIKGLSAHMRHLINGAGSKGLQWAFLLASHSDVIAHIPALPAQHEELSACYEWLVGKGDVISQVGAIEYGLSVLDLQPGIAPHMTAMLKAIRDDDVDATHSRVRTLSSLFWLVDGELSQTKILAHCPAFYRRLAALAQTSLIQRSAPVHTFAAPDFEEWAADVRGQRFYYQSCCDLRSEPRWLPDLAVPSQLKSEFVGRIFAAGQTHAAKIDDGELRALLTGDGEDALKRHLELPRAFLLGPLEGSASLPRALPADVEAEVERRLATEIIEPSTFAPLVAASLIFQVGVNHAELAARCLRSVNYHIKNAAESESLVPIVGGLAHLAAATRSTTLADDVWIVVRRARSGSSRMFSDHDALRVALIAAASRASLSDWCESVGRWVTELAFTCSNVDDARQLHGLVLMLCDIVPELWATCGRAESALRAYSGF